MLRDKCCQNYRFLIHFKTKSQEFNSAPDLVYIQFSELGSTTNKTLLILLEIFETVPKIASVPSPKDIFSSVPSCKQKLERIKFLTLNVLWIQR